MKSILLALLTLFCFKASAHQDFISSVSKGNIHFKYKTGWDLFEIDNKLDILLDLSEKLVQDQNLYATHILFYFEHDYTQRDSAFTVLGYGSFTYNEHETDTLGSEIETNGIMLTIHARDIDIKQTLSLIHAALKNAKMIQANQRQMTIKKNFTSNGHEQFDTFYSITPIQINAILNDPDTTVDRLVSEKTYRYYSVDAKSSPRIIYFYQNDSFHIYRSDFPNDVLLTLKNVHELLLKGEIIFLNDSIFYFIRLDSLKSNGPHTIENTTPGRPPIRQAGWYAGPLERYSLFLSDHFELRNVVFFPDNGGLVISDFDQLEKEFLERIRNQGQSIHEQEKLKLKDIAILTVLLGSIALNIWFIIKGRTSK